MTNGAKRVLLEFAVGPGQRSTAAEVPSLHSPENRLKRRAGAVAVSSPVGRAFPRRMSR